MGEYQTSRDLDSWRSELKLKSSLIVFIGVFLFSLVLKAQTEIPAVAQPKICTTEIRMDGAIGPASLAMLEKGLEKAQSKKCKSLLVTINTPGGSLQTTRLIVEKILNSPIPVLCLVSPSGGHAGSAGAIILQACHVNGAMVATNIGAATPIAGTGQEMPEDLRKKLINDTRSWMESITRLRDRSEKFGQDIVTEAKAVSAQEAHELGAIDFVATRKMDFLEFAEGREVKMSEEKKEKVVVGDLIAVEPTLRDHFLALFGDPQIAYLLFMGSLALLYFEITHPGTMIAGVVGGVGLVLALIALHKLQVEWGGLLLIALGLGLLIAEAFIPSFGILGVGGVVSFFIGSLFLFDPEKTGGYQLPLSLILTTTITLGGVMFGLAYLAFKTLGLKPKWGGGEMSQREAKVVAIHEGGTEGQVEVLGEIWKFKSSSPVVVGQSVLIQKIKGLTLIISDKKES